MDINIRKRGYEGCCKRVDRNNFENNFLASISRFPDICIYWNIKNHPILREVLKHFLYTVRQNIFV